MEGGIQQVNKIILDLKSISSVNQLMSDPIQFLIDNDFVRICADYLSSPDPKERFEAALALKTISDGTTDRKRAIVEALPKLLSMLRSASIDGSDTPAVEQSILAIRNIALDDNDTYDEVLKCETVEILLEIAEKRPEIPFMRHVLKLLSKLCKHGNRPVDKANLIITALKEIFSYGDSRVLAYILRILNHLTDHDTSGRGIESVVAAGFVPELVKIFDHTEHAVRNHSLATVGNIFARNNLGSNEQKSILMQYDVLKYMENLLHSTNKKTTRLAVWILSNITTDKEIFNMVYDEKLFVGITEVLKNGSQDSKRFAAKTITNAIVLGTKEQVLAIFATFEVLMAYFLRLKMEEEAEAEEKKKDVISILYGLGKLFEYGADKAFLQQIFVRLFEYGNLLPTLAPLNASNDRDIVAAVKKIYDHYNSFVKPPQFSHPN